MTRRNRIRYKSQGNLFPTITLTGKVFLRHAEPESIAGAAKGDLQMYLSTDSFVHNKNIGDYDAMGLDGYLKAEVFDGKGWKPVSLEEFFSGREYYFGKRERPADVYRLCLPMLEQLQGTVLMRTYREHYVKADANAKTLDGENPS